MMKGKIVLMLGALCCMQFISCDSAKERRPVNIVIIMADDLGIECINTYGGTSYSTPNLDCMAEEGIRFEHCHAQPLCTPSRVQIMTGRYNVRNYVDFGLLDRSEITFSNLLKDAGYHTVIAGKWQLGKDKDAPKHFGFDEACLWQHAASRIDEEGRDTRYPNPLLEINGERKRFTNGEYAPDVVSDFLCDFMERNRENPFLVYYPMILTHCPFVPTPDSEHWDPQNMGSKSYKGDTAFFADMVNYMDKMAGKLISKIEELGLSEHTLILFTGDNGTDKPVVSRFKGSEYPGGKGLTTDNGTHVPLIVKWTGIIEEGQVCNDLVDFSDVLPTICEAAHIELPSDRIIDGLSFYPQLTGKKGQPRAHIYSWYKPRKKNTLKEFVRNKEYKLYRTGEFYRVKVDPYEQSSINKEDLDSTEIKDYNRLWSALHAYR